MPSPKKIPDFEKSTGILAHVVADSVVGELSYWAHNNGFLDEAAMLDQQRDLISEDFDARTKLCYHINGHFRRSLNKAGNAGRDQLYVFHRHWLAAKVLKEHPAMFNKLPTGYRVGEELPRN